MRKAKSPKPADVYVGKRVRARRGVLGLTQGTLAAELGLTFQQVQKYEKGVNRISASRLHDLARVLRVPIEFFFQGLPNQASSRSLASDFLDSPEGIAIAKAFARVKGKALRRRLVELVQEIARSSGE